MKIDNKLTFPYPVLGVKDDILPLPDFKYKLEETDISYFLSVEVVLNNPSISYYIETSKVAEYVCEIDCVPTYYRICYKQTSPKFQIEIPKNSVCREINVTLSVIAKNEIQNYVNTNANDDYFGYKFNLQKGDLLAIIGNLTIQTDIKAEEFKTISSFIHFSQGKPKSQISFYLEGNDIEIRIPEEMFKIYVQKLKIEKFKPIIMASIINEALIYALLNYSTHTSKRWARILSTAVLNSPELSDYDLNDICGDDGKIDVQTAFDIARVLLKSPQTELFTMLNEIDQED